jgi:hypothetical protein
MTASPSRRDRPPGEVIAMVESRWFRRAGPGIAAVGAMALVATATLAARDRPWVPPPCVAELAIGPARAGSGAWFRIDPQLEAGERRGQRLVVGVAGRVRPRAMALDSESFVAGPFGGRILVGTDDGVASRLSVVDPVAGCAAAIGAASDVIRRATLSPTGDAVLEFRVDRRTRSDLGVWRRSLRDPGDVLRLLPPIVPDGRFGPTWSTEFTWSDDGAALAVQSCGEAACRSRVVRPDGSPLRDLADPELGELVGLDRERLVVRGACRGLPCPLYSIAISDGHRTPLGDGGAAIMTADSGGRAWAVFERDASGGLRSIRLDGTDATDIAPNPSGLRLVAPASRSGSGTDLVPGWVVLGQDGRLPLDGPIGPRFRRVPDGLTVPFEEVSR